MPRRPALGDIPLNFSRSIPLHTTDLRPVLVDPNRRLTARIDHTARLPQVMFENSLVNKRIRDSRFGADSPMT